MSPRVIIPSTLGYHPEQVSIICHESMSESGISTNELPYQLSKFGSAMDTISISLKIRDWLELLCRSTIMTLAKW